MSAGEAPASAGKGAGERPPAGGEDGRGGEDDSGGTDRCPACDALLPDRSGAADGAGVVERSGCMSCGVQLVRRPGGRWETIRG